MFKSAENLHRDRRIQPHTPPAQVVGAEMAFQLQSLAMVSPCWPLTVSTNYQRGLCRCRLSASAACDAFRYDLKRLGVARSCLSSPSPFSRASSSSPRYRAVTKGLSLDSVSVSLAARPIRHPSLCDLLLVFCAMVPFAQDRRMKCNGPGLHRARCVALRDPPRP